MQPSPIFSLNSTFPGPNPPALPTLKSELQESRAKAICHHCVPNITGIKPDIQEALSQSLLNE